MGSIALADLKSHRLERYMASNEPDFERKAADIISIYLDPSCHAAVFCVDEKIAIQALDCRDRVLPLSPGRAERHGFEYKRNGTLSLDAALNTKTGQVHGKTAARHTSQDFVEFLGEVVARCERDQEIHVILDNLSAHKTKQMAAFLEQHPDVALHFTPTLHGAHNGSKTFCRADPGEVNLLASNTTNQSASTELTGGAGFTFEDTAVAYYLVALLREERAAGQEGTVTSVAIQQAGHGHPMDDVIVEFKHDDSRLTPSPLDTAKYQLSWQVQVS